MISKQHDLHKRRFGRNLGVALTLGALIIVMMGLTVVKLTEGDVRGALEGTRGVTSSEGSN